MTVIICVYTSFHLLLWVPKGSGICLIDFLPWGSAECVIKKCLQKEQINDFFFFLDDSGNTQGQYAIVQANDGSGPNKAVIAELVLLKFR